MKWLPNTSPPPIPPPPPPDTHGKGVSCILWSADCCLHVANHSTCAFSDGDFFNALTDKDFDLLQVTEEERAELVAVVNQKGNDTTHTMGKSIFHMYFTHLKTSHVDQVRRPGQTLPDQIVCDGFEKLFPHTCDLQRGYTVNTRTNFKAKLGVIIPAPPSNLANSPIL